jgi:hypothetical protein
MPRFEPGHTRFMREPKFAGPSQAVRSNRLPVIQVHPPGDLISSRNPGALISRPSSPALDLRDPDPFSDLWNRRFVYSDAWCCRATARIADLMTGGRLFHLASSSANIGSIAALFAAPFGEWLDFSAESAIVRPLSWAIFHIIALTSVGHTATERTASKWPPT